VKGVEEKYAEARRIMLKFS